MRSLIVANWKMNTTLAEALVLANGVKKGMSALPTVDAVLCPPFPWLVPVADIIQDHPIKQLSLGAQNIFWKEEGAYTGEVAAPMLKGLVQYVIIGHSERRKHFHESDREIGRKVQLALSCDIRPILCIGELKAPSLAILDDPTALTARHLHQPLGELEAVLEGLPAADLPKLIVAYEPVWAISSNPGAKASTGAYANQVMALIRAKLAHHAGDAAEDMPILYGGSANETNAAEFMDQPEINGLLVGKACLSIRSFLATCRQAR